MSVTRAPFHADRAVDVGQLRADSPDSRLAYLSLSSQDVGDIASHELVRKARSTVTLHPLSVLESPVPVGADCAAA